MASGAPDALLARDDTADKLLELMKDPFGSEVATGSILAAIATSLSITTAVFLAFCILRPWNEVVYAPRLRHADEKHKPPPMDKSLFAWFKPVFKTDEHEYMHTIGMDATVFLRVARMCRNMFCCLALVGCGIILPVNVSKSTDIDGSKSFKNIIFLMTPMNLFGESYWAFVICAYAFDIIVCGFLWWTYRAIHGLRRKWMESAEYQNSLHSRTLMITDVARNLRTDQGIVEITDSIRATPDVPRASVGRNVKDIPELIEQHEEAVIDLEKVLAKYLKNPSQLPATRPMCRPSKKDREMVGKNQKVDAIDYLSARIQRLENKIREVRESIDKRDPMPYGFASYETIESAHTVAFAARGKKVKGAIVQLAPKPKDIIWKNLAVNASTRRWRGFVNGLWVTLLTLLYFIPNALIAVFVAQLSNIAILWPQFGEEMSRNPKTWSIVQGIAAPALTSLFYYFLPIIFRRLSMRAGDLSKTSRERHVISRLYSFFLINNLLVFSLFAAVFKLIVATINVARNSDAVWYKILNDVHPFVNTMVALCQMSPYWVTWLVQRNLGAAIDLSQAVNLGWGSFSRKFLNPTPRELIQRTAPPPFDYASYYNYFLFYSTVALCFGSLQPITLVVTAFYFGIDSAFKKYLLLYVFATKNESGGVYWRTIYNRFMLALFLNNAIIALMVGARGSDIKMMLGVMAPIPFLLIGFKFYCKKTFDSSMRYYTKGETPKGVEAPPPIDKESRRRDRVAVRFGHPALYQKLTVPMVHEKSKHLLAEVYRGRLDGDVGSTGYSDMYSMKRMSKENPGKAEAATGPFEFVSEGNMDFENYKNRPEFADMAGGGSDAGSIYGGSTISRPGTPSTVMGGTGRGRSFTTGSDKEEGVTYPAGYHHTPSNLREYSPSPGPGYHELNRTESRDDANLLGGAQPMGAHTPLGSAYTPYSDQTGNGQKDYFGR